MSKALLHVSKLADFKAFLESQGIAHRPGRGAYQVLQVCKDGVHWNCVYTRDAMPEHFTTDRHLDNLVIRFARSAKGRVVEADSPQAIAPLENTLAKPQGGAVTELCVQAGVDWALLRQQKDALVDMADDEDRLTSEIEVLDGVIALLDSLQDAAVRLGKASQLEVFGEPEADVQGDGDTDGTACPSCGADGGTSCGAVHCAY